MSDVLTPAQLPQSNAQFIAYGPEERAADPMGGDPLTVRAQTYLRYYRDILIKTLQEGGQDGDKSDLLTIVFDPQSVGLNKPIKAHMDLDDATVGLLREAHANQQPVSVAIETQRKKKSTTDKSPISPLTPIHALRGADNPDGSGHHENMMGPSGANTTNRLVMVNGRATKHIVSNPLEWSMLVSNKAGDLPPEGWRYFAPGKDWKEYGSIVPSGVPASAAAPQAAQAAPALDMGALRALMAEVLNEVLDSRESPEPEQVTGRPSNSRRFYEGKPWDSRTSDGRIHLGSYPVISERSSLRWAHSYLVKQHATEEKPEPSIDIEEAWSLSAVVMDLSDRVQSQSYAALVDGGQGAPTEPNRLTGSHTEARRWVEWVIEQVHPYPQPQEEPDSAEDAPQTEEAYAEVQRSWAEQVVAEATEMFARAGRNVGHVLAEKAKADKERRQAQPAAPQQDQPSGPSPSVVRALLDTATRSWGDQQVLANLGVQANERGFSEVMVSMVSGEDGKPVISYPAVEGQTSGTLHALLRHRWQELNGGRSDGPAPSEPAESPNATAAQGNETAPEAQSTTAPQGDDPNRGYTPEVASAIRQIHQCGTLNALKEVYVGLRSANLLASTVFVNPRPEGGFEFGPNNASGYVKRSLSDVLNDIRRDFESRGSAAPEQGSESAPATESTASEDTPQADAPEAPAPEAEQQQQEESTPEVQAPEESTPEREASPEANAEPESAPAEEDGFQSESEAPSRAQEIADKASTLTDVSEIEALIKVAQDEGVYEDRVAQRSAAGREVSGPLRSWLKQCIIRTKANQGG